MVVLAGESGDVELVLQARLGRLADLMEQGAMQVAKAEIGECLLLAARLKQPYYLWRAATWDALLAMVDGRLADAETRAKEAVAVWGGSRIPTPSNVRGCNAPPCRWFTRGSGTQ